MNNHEKIVTIAEAYLNIVTEGTVNQIAGFIREGSFRIPGGAPTISEVKGALQKSTIFLNNKVSGGMTVYRLNDER